jgi:hypothetical protein
MIGTRRRYGIREHAKRVRDPFLSIRNARVLAWDHAFSMILAIGARLSSVLSIK